MSQFNLIVILVLLASCAAPRAKKEVIHYHSTDTHMHIHPSSEGEDMKFNASRALFAADSVGLQRAIVLSNAYSKMTYKDHARTQNSFVASEVRKNKTKLAGACAVNPLMDWARDEIINCHREGLKVLKLHTLASGMDLRQLDDQKDLRKVLTTAKELKLTVLVHGNFPKSSRGNEAEVLLKILTDYPEVRFIIGHLLGRENEALKNFKHPNFMVEVSGLHLWTKNPEEKKKLVAMMREIGLHKFVFGSDWPVFHPAEVVKALNELPLEAHEIKKIVYTNAKALDDLFAK